MRNCGAVLRAITTALLDLPKLCSRPDVELLHQLLPSAMLAVLAELGASKLIPTEVGDIVSGCVTPLDGEMVRMIGEHRGVACLARPLQMRVPNGDAVLLPASRVIGLACI